MIKKKNPHMKAVILGIAIALVSVFFFTYAIQSVYPVPEYENYCGKYIDGPEISSEAECIAIEGKWTDYKAISLENEPKGHCDRDFVCREEHKEAKKIYERNVFFINSIIGISIFVIGFFLAIAAVSGGLMGGGVIMMFYGTIRYWSNFSDILRTLVLGLSLAILIWLGYKKLNN